MTIRNRIVGKTHAMVLSMISTLENGGKVAVAGCNPQPILNRLKQLGANIKRI